MSTHKTRVIYAFPHAGASASVYRPFCKEHEAEGSTLLQPVEMPGRGVLAREPEVTNLDGLAEQLADTIYRDFRQKQQQGIHEWATFGHSFGGVLSVVVTNVLANKYGMYPVFSVVSGSVPPSEQAEDDLHLWSDESLLEKMREDQGTPAIVLNEPVLAKRYVAQIRTDFQIRSQFLQRKAMQVSQPLILIAASDDPHVTEATIQAWQRHTAGETTLLHLNGDHFAVYQHWPVIRQVMEVDESNRLEEENRMDSWSVFQ
ncbi:thioesterase II family protein [Photobacterium galatheae]|uniref:Oleoyl-ACP hydrolase n=1 Tax=Photobacterium galatheae TaxID=1654360 RepID=A0A066RHA5_9GAMM|nr:thioesterase domain-containing protein [Photobacterium galatheae]KDM89830.1 oleoyl-ACP hydrolase [Photobacterium galatheae]MCM0151127.1 thioesterase [Photobacterium galatheae]